MMRGLQKLMPVPIETIEVVECPHKTCGIFIADVPRLTPGVIYICPYCRNGFEPKKRMIINVYKIKPA